MALLNGLADLFDGLISALDALGEGEKFPTFGLVKIRCQKEEQHHATRYQDVRSKSENVTLFYHNKSNSCYQKHPHLAPPDSSRRKKNALLFTQKSSKSSEFSFAAYEYFLRDRITDSSILDVPGKWHMIEVCLLHTIQFLTPHSIWVLIKVLISLNKAIWYRKFLSTEKREMHHQKC